ncbi:TetR/AcrR family transcriptional regulator [Arthrobacter sp. TMN-37]
MSVASRPIGRRERNKQEKLDRITAAASELFAEHGVDEVTTQQIAEKADIGTGTLFLYAKTKGELLLMVQNARYEAGLKRGRADAEAAPNVMEAVLAVVRPIVECNRTQVENGRTYLREIVFGDPAEPHHGEAMSIVVETEEVLADVVRRDGRYGENEARTVARLVSAVIFFSMAIGLNAPFTTEEMMEEIRRQLALVLHS